MKKLISKSERFFIAGSRGMVGQAIVKALRKSGYGKKEYGGILLTPSRKELNLLNREEVEKWFEINKPTIVVLAAAKVGGIFANDSKPTEFLLENLKIQLNVIELAWEYGVKRLLFLGSSCIYPKFAEQPIKEESLLSGLLEPTNQWYAIAKIAGIKLCEALRKQNKFDAICLMPTNLYGPGDNYHPENSHVMASLIRKFYLASKNSLPSVTCWGTGTPLREFMHVNDLANASIFALERWNPDAENAPLDKYGKPLLFLNVGTGKDLSIKDLAEKIAEITNFKGQILWDKSKPDGTPKKLLNTDKLTNLGWGNTIDLTKGIKNAISDFEMNNCLEN
tara:strand:+ start:332 stop:1339 length:1008 start_codon:yes stop_codon:yes gene_type:complete